MLTDRPVGGPIAVKAAYLAGPMRSVPEFNYPAFMAGAKLLREEGWVVFNPAEMDIELDGVSEDGSDVEAGTPASARRYADRDTDLIIRKLKSENGDAIVTLDGWRDSIGARAEVACAEWVYLAHFNVAEAIAEMA